MAIAFNPQLWVSTVFAGIALIVLIYRAVFTFNRVKLACAVVGGFIFILTIINTLSTYPFVAQNSPFQKADTLIFSFITVVYLNVLVAVYLDVGGTFLKVIESVAFDGISLNFRRRQRRLKHSSVGTSVLGSVLAIVLGALVAFARIDTYHYQAFITLTVITVLTVLYSIISSIIYAFIPLITKHNGVQAAQSQAHSIGVWYLALLVPILSAHVTFYLYAFSCQNPFNSVNKGIDLSIRSILLFAYGLPPNRAIIRWWRSRMTTAHGNSMQIHGVSPNAPYQHSPKLNNDIPLSLSQTHITGSTSAPSSSAV